MIRHNDQQNHSRGLYFGAIYTQFILKPTFIKQTNQLYNYI